ncbi:hypothetical protein ID866_8368 [Astraeus odoratus]|nr:hypothetical protein ID866_8368 [Astraeus odoratus]
MCKPGGCGSSPSMADTSESISLPLCYSSIKAHALSNSDMLLGDIPHASWDYHKLTPQGTKGWLLGPQDQPLLWIPPTLLPSPPRFHGPDHIMVMPRSVELDLSRMVHGPKWMDCQRP